MATPHRPPLLYYGRFILEYRDWTVRELSWDRLPADVDIADAAGRAVRNVDASQHLILAKSIGTHALPAAAELDLPGVWLTPLLGVDSIVAAAGRTSAPTLLVGGTADRHGRAGGRAGWNWQPGPPRAGR